MKSKRFFAIITTTVLLFQLMSSAGLASENQYFDSAQKAAIDFAKNYNGKSIKANREYGSTIYKLSNGKYTYTEPAIGDRTSVMPSGYYNLSSKVRSLNPIEIADVHTHGRSGNNFSRMDYQHAKDCIIDEMYMSNSTGDLYITKKSEGWRSRKIADEDQGIKHDKRDSSVKWKSGKYVWNHWFGGSRWCSDCAD